MTDHELLHNVDEGTAKILMLNFKRILKSTPAHFGLFLMWLVTQNIILSSRFDKARSLDARYEDWLTNPDVSWREKWEIALRGVGIGGMLWVGSASHYHQYSKKFIDIINAENEKTRALIRKMSNPSVLAKRQRTGKPNFGRGKSARENVAENLLFMMSKLTLHVPGHGTLWQFFSNWLHQDPVAINIYQNADVVGKWVIFKYFEQQLPIRVQALLLQMRDGLDIPR